jgi:hypothetical protein
MPDKLELHHDFLTSSCCPFGMVRAGTLVMPDGMRPTRSAILEAAGSDEVIDKMWEKLIWDKISSIQRTLREPPVCPEHYWHGIHLELKILRVHLYEAHLYWVCPGKYAGEDWVLHVLQYIPVGPVSRLTIRIDL